MSIIAISRGTLSGGEQVARAVADRLGYRCVGREVIYEAAQRYAVPPDALIESLERRPPFWNRLLGKRTAHVTFMQAALCEYARGGNLVYHGHVGHLLLPGIAHVLRVRVIADLEPRISALMQSQRLGRQEAAVYIARVDKERRQWARSVFDVKWDDPLLYDLVLNITRLSVASACELVVRSAALPEFTPTPASVQAMRDLTVSSRVSAALASDPRTRDTNFQVQVQAGTVTIAGTTQSPQVIQATAIIAEQVEGVLAVRCDMRLLREGAPYDPTVSLSKA